AVASYGENPYGHPHPETVCRLQQAGATLYATPMSPGAVVVVSDGQAARVLQGEPARAEPCS
ncbi:MAG TPA: MBL fold metallo-hydrolase, partial [Candidatus Thermoplasmatota archaeon]|nr:MBL fold metallo-hydrolase [Candidatus Thermoplasmatota archaeon]